MLGGRLAEHPLRYALTNELHARPFTELDAPGRALHIAIMPPENAAERDRTADLAHLTALLDRYGGAHPAPEANHHSADFGAFRLKWERHTEFVSYTLYEQGPATSLFAASLARHFPEDWLAAAPGVVIAANQVEVLRAASYEEALRIHSEVLLPHFFGESLASARVLDDNAIACGDFRIHADGFARFAVVVHGPIGPRRTGRIVQRLVEIETYSTLALLALPVARALAPEMNRIERQLTRLAEQVAEDRGVSPDAQLLGELTTLSAEIEARAAATAFRFAAATAYEAIVGERIAMLREERISGRQLFSEFMVRRFDPAMRTCHAAERRLADLAARASRIAELLLARVNVAVEAQNQQLLASMDRRAALQLRLQEMVEGFSVVAISYYAVNLLGYLLGPLAHRAGVGHSLLIAMAVPPVLIGVAFAVRRMRRRLAVGPGVPRG